MLGKIVSFKVWSKGILGKLFFESHTEGIYRSDGSVLEEELKKKLPETIQSDTPPETIPHGKIIAGLTKAWIGNAENKPLEIGIPPVAVSTYSASPTKSRKKR